MLVRYHLPEKIRYTTLFYYSEKPPPALPDWFNRYNARQTIEAGIKEEKEVFTLKRHLVRSPIGMQLQEQFALFGANFIRWAAAWVKDLLSQANPYFITALDQVKTLARVVSRSRALFDWPGCSSIAFTIVQFCALLKHVAANCATVRPKVIFIGCGHYVGMILIFLKL